MQLVQVDARQHDVVITDCDNGIAELLLGLNGPVAVLGGTNEYQLVDARRKVGNCCVDVVFSDDKGIRAAHALHYCMLSGASEENIRVWTTYERVGSI